MNARTLKELGKVGKDMNKENLKKELKLDRSMTG